MKELLKRKKRQQKLRGKEVADTNGYDKEYDYNAR
jgi:hypothetical protein